MLRPVTHPGGGSFCRQLDSLYDGPAYCLTKFMEERHG